MVSPKQVVKSVGPKLVPFFKAVAIYFVVFPPADQPTWWALLLKCLPIYSLVFFVLLHGMSLGNEYAFSRRILIGLIFSSFGDALLMWPHLFLHGMFSFGIGHLFYISAFGFRPLNLKLGLALYAIAFLGMSVFLSNLDTLHLICVPVYTCVLFTMVWRAIARVQFFQELWTWTKLCSCVGGVLFALSDSVIGFHHFYMTVPYSQVLIMTTYYAAQLGIALSVVDSKASYMRDMEQQQQQEQQQRPEVGSSSSSSRFTQVKRRTNKSSCNTAH